jgi:CRISPR-associated protein Csd2
VTTEEEAEQQEGGNRTMGRKFAVPYGLYRVHAYVNPNLASGERGTGFSEEDLDLLKQALDRMFELDRSAARANMRPVACVAFKHESPFGNSRADRLFARVTCIPKRGVQPLPGEDGREAEGRPPRAFADYELQLDDRDLPAGVTAERWIEWE